MGKLTVTGTSLNAALHQMIREQQALIKRFNSAVSKNVVSDVFTCAKQLYRVGIGWNRTGQVSELALGQVLSSFRGTWKTLPDKFTSQYEDSFERFAQETYMLGQGKAHTLADEWEIIMSGKYIKRLPANVDPYSLSTTRRQAAARLILDGKMTPEKWSIILDENLTNRQIYAKLFGKHRTMSGKRKKSFSRFVSSTGEMQLITAEGVIKFLGSFDFKTEDMIARHEMVRILKAAGVEFVP